MSAPRSTEPEDEPDGRWLPGLASAVVGPSVLVTAVAGGEVYVGGDFTYGTAGMAGGTYNRVARWDGVGWRRLGDGLDGTVRAAVVVGDDVYVGGDLTAAGGVPAARLARWDGRAWHPVSGGVTDPDAEHGCTVNALASDGARLFVGGVFTVAGDLPVRSLAVLDLATGTWSDPGRVLRGATWGQDDAGTVNALVLHDGALHVGGRFDTVGTVTTHSFATLDTRTGTWTGYGSGVRDEEHIGTVSCLAVDPATRAVHVGGTFTEAGGVPAQNLARLDGDRFTAHGDVSLYGGRYAEVHALACAGGLLHVGGSFDQVGPSQVRCWAVHDGTSWSAPAEPLDNVVRTLTARGDAVVVGGDFDNAGTLRVQKLGVWSSRGWELLGQGPVSGYFSGGQVDAVVATEDGAYVGGLFDQAGAVRLGSVGRWTGQGWDPMAGGVAAEVGPGHVLALAVLGGRLYAAGSFDTAGGVPARGVACWDGQRWSALGTGLDSQAHALAVLGGRLYVGGRFSTAGDLLVGGLACWDPGQESWSVVGNGPLYDHHVDALAVIGDRHLVVGGTFNGFNAPGGKVVEGLHGLAVFDTHAPLDPGAVLSGYGVLPGVSRYGAAGWVRALQVVGGDLYVGGWFDRAGIVRTADVQSPGFEAGNLVVWHFSTTDAWEPVGNPDRDLHALAAVDGDLVAAGAFTTVGGVPAARLARLDRATGTWSEVGGGLRNGADEDHTTARALAAAADGGLWVGGAFTSAGDEPSANLARRQAALRPDPDPTVGPGTYEESSPSLVWTGAWSRLASRRDSGAGARQARGGPASVQLRFVGTGVRWVSRRGRTSGRNDVYLDDELVATVDRYAPATRHRATVWQVDGLPAGPHTVRIQHTGDRHQDATDDTVVLDALVVT